jgi:leucyl-tRNA synthetase
MPQWAGSCWYFLRFIDPRNSQRFVGAEQEQAWMPVDLYVGGAEHAVLHLLYSRFWHKVLYDRGHVSCPEPFQKLVNQGMILGEMEYRVSPEVYAAHRDEIERGCRKVVHLRDDDGEDIFILKELAAPAPLINLSDEQIEKRKGKIFLKGTEIELTGRSDKMSKSRGNVVNPEDVVEQYGADSLRLYEMFMGPLEATKPWSMQGVSGVRNFLDRVWRLLVDTSDDATVGHVSNVPSAGEPPALRLNAAVQDVPATDEQNRILHKTIKAVTHDIEKLLVNTAIARMMEFVNFFTKETVRPRGAMEQFVLLLSPYAPHIAEELWQLLGHKESLAYEPWPTYDESLTVDASVEIPVQIKGKLRAKIQVPAGLDAAALEAAARADAKVAEQLAGQTVVKVIAVPGKLVNFVTK